jgi:hypothetical protein
MLIRIPVLLAASFFLFTVVHAGENDGKVTLFNGKDLDGWIAEGAKEYKAGDKVIPVWTVKDGLLNCDGKGFGFLRYNKREFADFHFHLEYRMQAKCNSGVGIRTPVYDPKRSTETRPSMASYEIQLIDDFGKDPNKHSNGSLYRYVAPASNAANKPGEWNVLDIECAGPKIVIHLNKTKIIDFDQSTDEKLKKNPLKGYVCVQNHGGKIDFRNLWVREIKSVK